MSALTEPSFTLLWENRRTLCEYLKRGYIDSQRDLIVSLGVDRMAELDTWLAGLERILQQMDAYYKSGNYGSIGM